MHPALSVIFFTVISGFGYGLWMVLAVAGLSDAWISQRVGVPASSLAFILMTAGLLSSMLHLANPKNAWRAISRVRTSWLAREGAFALLFYLPAVLYLTSWWFNDARSLYWFGLSVTLFILAICVVFSTGMIYACLKTIRQWHTPLVPTNYLLYALYSGATTLLGLQAFLEHDVHATWRWGTIGLLGVCFITHSIYLFWIQKSQGSSMQTATGFTQARVRLLDVGHSGGTFLTDEFGYIQKVSSRTLTLLRLCGVVFLFVVPLAALLAAPHCPHMMTGLYVVTPLSILVGLFIERWLFFSQANHVVNLYHGISPSA